MLKALELAGFKSFADKTRFEFPRGVTVVVGPNGSGKSNVVDAIKWVLGEQSVKSLRGKEMADVIFNGSSDRRALNAAETTLTLDNAAATLPIDTPEVHITRRVYRSGEGEYLINRQPCRLRDIRDLLAGTGLSTEAYSVIEQGKVDILLQSSPRERRLIFEEAAGISRFKAKKLESIRRLERVDQNLLRLSDIVEEVGSRLRSVRLQAGKARLFREYSDRLQTLRTQIGQSDWRTLSGRLQAIEAELGTVRRESTEHLAEADVIDARIAALEAKIVESDAIMRSGEGAITQNRERIAALETSVEHERLRSAELEEQVARYRRQSTSMSVRAGDLQQRLRETSDALAAAERAHRAVAGQLAEHERGLTKLTIQVDEEHLAGEQRRAAHLEQLRSRSTLASRIGVLESKVATARATLERAATRLAELTAARDGLAAEAEQSRAQAEDLGQRVGQKHRELEALQARFDELRQQAARTQEQLGQLRKRHCGASERASLLDELEKRLEGVSAGVKQVLAQAQGASSGFGKIHGLVADLLHVNFETAPLVEVALGDLAGCLVVAGGRELVDHLQGSMALAGRVGLIRLDAMPPKSHLDQVDLHGRPGVLGRADEFVETEPEFAVLARRLLAKTWIVETLADALGLSESVGRGLCFVTRSLEQVAADGTLYVGPRHTATGLISRRSELRTLRQQIVDMAEGIDRQQAALAELEGEIVDQDRQLRTLVAEHETLGEAFGRERLRAATAAERLAQLESQRAAVETELNATRNEHQRSSAELDNSRAQLLAIDGAVAELESRIAEGGRRAAELEAGRQRASRETNAAKIEVVKSEQRLAHLQAQRSQLERDQQERGRALADSRTQLGVCLARLKELERDILAAESKLAELYLRKEQFAVQSMSRVAQRDAWHEEKVQLAASSQRLRAKIRKLEARLHAKELAAGEVRHERAALAERLREDYGIELATLAAEASDEELAERAAVEEEIADLRSRLNSIGNVNLDALAELEELETRHTSLSTQHQDLSAAKASLEEIIDKINEDSRRLFGDTLELVRGHFQSLFRKLFGGGQADIVLDQTTDILDSGIEIIARPPGKEPRNISLLSGGEKTLTCVAMLLAIFRSRPSPFCVLDEVDAALDEANIERFIGVLQEFSSWTQFIVVTHSKKTMTCADTLYGVTMQESGISKRVSVRFEDVSEKGEIIATAPDASTADDETQAA